ncbi:MAG TPA: twin-arginine translocase TatA/TatE family subunit [Thermodesulfovibrionales bacterium]|nr:twin-arginine translocase TatA/TatE family subunit [Thermodesulfovibrionales bacterium]
MFEGLFQPMHLIIILAIALIIFGPGKLPQIGAGLGQSIREFKKALSPDDKDKSSVPEKRAATESDTKNEKT